MDYYAPDGCCELMHAAMPQGLPCSEQRDELESRLQGGAAFDELEGFCRSAIEAGVAAEICEPPSRGSTGGDGEVPTSGSPICDRFIGCTAAVVPAGLAEVIEGYGENGSCYATLQRDACERACSSGLLSLREYPGSGIDECAICASDAECFDPERPACVDGSCVECVAESDCGGDRPGCDTDRNVCVACTENRHCPASRPGCDADRNVCVACTEDRHCPADRPGCDTARNICIACTADRHCPTDRPVCHPGSNVCVACTDDTHCPAELPFCVGPDGCGECRFNEDCGTGFCDADTSTCCPEPFCQPD